MARCLSLPVIPCRRKPVPIMEPKLISEALGVGSEGMDSGDGRPCLKSALITSGALAVLPVLPRPRILGEWLREGDLGYLYAPRGHGKTWLAMLIGNAIAEGLPLGLWKAGEGARRVVYFDAEMNLPDVKARAALIGIKSDRFEWLQNERVFETLRRALNIASPADQSEIGSLLNEGDVLIVDNLSTAASGMAENDNDAFDLVKDWILELRGRKITVLIVHHAGRNGEMRGASRREDMAHWIISLRDDSGEGETKAWVTAFKKLRNCQAADAPPLRWTISTQGDRLDYDCKKHSGAEALLAMIREGIGSASELAGELGVTTGCVSKWASKLMKDGAVRKEGRDYVAI